MPKLTPIQLDENTIIYIEATEDIEAKVPLEDNPNDIDNVISQGDSDDFKRHIQDLQSTIFTYTSYTLAAFKKVAVANIKTVTLEFGVEVGGEAGIPYVTKGTAKSNLKIQVECSFADDKNQETK